MFLVFVYYLDIRIRIPQQYICSFILPFTMVLSFGPLGDARNFNTREFRSKNTSSGPKRHLKITIPWHSFLWKRFLVSIKTVRLWRKNKLNPKTRLHIMAKHHYSDKCIYVLSVDKRDFDHKQYFSVLLTETWTFVNYTDYMNISV